MHLALYRVLVCDIAGDSSSACHCPKLPEMPGMLMVKNREKNRGETGENRGETGPQRSLAEKTGALRSPAEPGF